VEVLERVSAVGKGDVVLLEEVHQADCVIGRLSLAVGGNAENDERILGHGIQVVKVVSEAPALALDKTVMMEGRGQKRAHSSGSQTRDDSP
jgi:hypothetical protein